MQVASCFIFSEEFTVNEKMIYMIIASNSTGKTCKMSIKQIANNANLTSSTITKTLKSLQNKQMIKFSEPKPYEIRNIIKSKDLEGYGIGDKRCEWCGINTYVIHKHHFPIRREDGGIKTVSICPNCHHEYHHLETNIEILNSNYFNMHK